MLELRLQRSVGGFGLDLDLSLDAGTVGIFGPSGAGKSTLLHLVAGLIRPDSGRIVLDGDVLCDTRAGIWTPPHRRGVGVVFQDSRLFPHYSVEGNLRYGMGPTPPGAGRIDFESVVEVLELGPLLGRQGGRISGGERQRVALGRALLASPRLLLLDEPLASLDRALRSQILVFLRRVRDAFGVPMLLVSHDLTEILQMTGELVVVSGGRHVAGGKLLDVIREPRALELMHDPGPINVLAGVVAGGDRAGGVTELRLGSGEAAITVPRQDDPPGTEKLVLLRPLDVGLSVEPSGGMSFRNRLPGVVVDVVDAGTRQLVLVDMGEVIMAEVTPDASRELALRPGRELWCLFKAHALNVLPA